jgi:hypothetical protein
MGVDRAKALEREVLRRLDPKGEMAQVLDVFGPLVDSRLGRGSSVLSSSWPRSTWSSSARRLPRRGY